MRDDLPSGTVTFLFTDVEGSTKLLHELGAEAYAAALADHRRLIRNACAAHGGVEVDTQGDAFFFAFPTAPGALEAAGEMTEALASGPIQVRIGLHSGTPLLTNEGYVGDDVHFAARVTASSHGGQVVLSSATAELVEIEVTDLGEHRLKDIEHAVSIFQLGDGSFPPLKTISNTNLPRPASSFVGRERELEEVLARIESGARLVTLTGPGGSGKTRLALEAASSLVPEHRAGVFWVGLAALRDPALVSETISQTLGAKDSLAEHIGEREMLLLLDNLEQVIEAAPELSALLTDCSNLTLLVTSRELLRVQGEVEYPVPPLAEPEAVALFCARSQLEPSQEIAELCTRLDSLPLAVELAAARVKALSPAQILERISQRLDLLKGGRDADPRQQTLRATIEWSYSLLSAEERQLFARLSVFAGGCTLEAAEEVADADLDTLQSLVEKSLLRFSASEAGSRYWMLETIREYAGERLAEAGEDDALRRRHSEYVLTFTAGADEGLQTPDAERWLLSLESEHGNIRAALSWLAQAGQIDMQLDLIGQMWRFWTISGAWQEGRRWVDAGLRGSEGARSAQRAVALRGATVFSLQLGDVEAAKTYGEEGLSIRQELGDPKDIGHGLSILATVAADQGEYDEAERLIEEAAVLLRDGEATRALRAGNLGDVAMRRGEYRRAIALFEESLAHFRELGRDGGISWALYNLAFCLFRVGRRDEALPFARDALTLSSRRGEVENLIWMFGLAASVASDAAQPEAGARLIGAADGLREQVGLRLKGAEAGLYRETVLEVREALGERYDTLHTEGRAMSSANAVRYALSCLD